MDSAILITTLVFGVYLGANSNLSIPAKEFNFKKCEVDIYVVSFNEVTRVKCKNGASYDVKRK